MTHVFRLALLLALACLALPLGARAEAQPQDPPPNAKPGEPAASEEAPPAGRKAEQKDFPPPEGVTAPGMVFVPAGKAVIGTTYPRLMKLLRNRPKDQQDQFLYEAPQHTVDMPAYFVDRCEVTNAQYHLFLQKTAAASYDTNDATLANLEEVAGKLMNLPPDEWKKDDVAWRQLYRHEPNKKQLWEKMPDRVKKDAQGNVLEKETEDNFHYAPLVRGMKLEFYDRKPPMTWPEMAPYAFSLDQPVAAVSYDDAEAFAEWAGKHIPTEVEWEYAARGPRGYYFPWGDEWYDDASHANWGAKITPLTYLPKDGQKKLLEELHATTKTPLYTPMAVPVGDLPDGRSWCGTFNQLGNVAEWTSSWFNPYPGYKGEKNPYMGAYVKVIRGASYRDQEPLVLRLAARNFLGAGVLAPPRPGNRFELVGFRCAWYPEGGRNRLEPMIRRITRSRIVKPEEMAQARYAGASAVHWVGQGGDTTNHVFVREASRGIVILPLEHVRGTDQQKKLKNRKHLLDASEGPDPIPIAVFHTDLPLDKVLIPVKERPGTRRPSHPTAPATEKGVCTPGTYFLAIWWGRLCLTMGSLEPVCFLTTTKVATTDEIDVKELKAEQIQPAYLKMPAGQDFVFIGFQVPVAPVPAAAKERDKYTTIVVKTITLNFQKGTLQDAGPWRLHP